MVGAHRVLARLLTGAYALERIPARLDRACAEAGLPVEVLAGRDGLERVASLPEVDCVMAAIVGAAGLLPTLAAVRAGKRVLLANKEALVMSGDLFMAEAREHAAQILPIDSEHNAIFQCLPDGFAADVGKAGIGALGVRRLLLTSSGGPFRELDTTALADVTPEQACAHPNWVMGRKISVDSATMMNKGLELIEACRLFATTPDGVQIVVHPQSVVHSLVEYADGSVLAQMATPDMRVPIAHALAWPGRIESGAPALDVFGIARLTFEPPDETRFPAIRLAYAAAREGGTAAAILNAANEEAVEAFLAGRLSFPAIASIVEGTRATLPAGPADELDAVLAADRQARDVARGLIDAGREGARC